MPTRKVGAGALAGAIVAVGVWAVKAFGHVEVPGETAAALVVIVTFITQYFVADA